MFSTTTSRALSRKIMAALLASATLLAATPSAPPADQKHLSIYSPVAVYTLPILDRAGHEYVGLLELLEPLGRVSTDSKGRSLRLHYNALEADFVAGGNRARIAGRDFDFLSPFLVENARGLVPLSSLGALLPRFLGTPVNFRESTGRLFIGDVAIQPSFRLEAGNPTRLAINFTAPVNPTISTEPGKLRMLFRRDPVVSPGSQSISFDSTLITHVSYSEADGDAQLDVTATEPLIATFSVDRRTIIVSPVPSAAAPAVAAQQSPPLPSPAPVNTVTSVHRILAVVDPAHGGDERGAALTDRLAEKDVTLGLARLLRHELEIRGFAVMLLRDTDSASTVDQRATAANVARAGIFITLHAASQGTGARVYTALLPVSGIDQGLFHAWNTAQAPALPTSRAVSAAVVTEMRKREFSAQASPASLRPLNNVSMPAVAVELAPGPNGITDLTSANYQQRAASAIADAVASVRDRLGAQP